MVFPYTYAIICEDVLSVMVIITGNEIQILNKVVCISHSTNTLGKMMNPSFLDLELNNLLWLIYHETMIYG